MRVRILEGDARERLRELPDDSVHCVVTSPPYWGLRDYGVPGQVGLEGSLAEYIEVLVRVFGEVRRVLRPDGIAWVNIGDPYAGSWGSQGHRESPEKISGGSIKHQPKRASHAGTIRDAGLKPKDMMLVPERFVLAMQADGWWVRRRIIWHKTNARPESVGDRPGAAHELVWMFAKSRRCFYDAPAVEVPVTDSSLARYRRGGKVKMPEHLTANLRDVWSMAVSNYRGGHFATFPVELAERCIAAGTSERGVCGVCGAPWRRIVERSAVGPEVERPADGWFRHPDGHGNKAATFRRGIVNTTVGWEPGCGCSEQYRRVPEVVPAKVLDPFAGAGTVAVAAARLGRDCLLVELNPDYAELARERCEVESRLFAEVVVDRGKPGENRAAAPCGRLQSARAGDRARG